VESEETGQSSERADLQANGITHISRAFRLTFLLRPGDQSLLDGILGDESIHLDLALLANAVTPILSLQVDLRIEVAVVVHDGAVKTEREQRTNSEWMLCSISARIPVLLLTQRPEKQKNNQPGVSECKRRTIS
jgi:hypothetical protein